MHTEDDTFNALRKPPRNEMHDKLMEFSENYIATKESNPDYSGEDYVMLRNEFLRKHGWIPVEYNHYFREDE